MAWQQYSIWSSSPSSSTWPSNALPPPMPSMPSVPPNWDTNSADYRQTENHPLQYAFSARTSIVRQTSASGPRRSNPSSSTIPLPQTSGVTSQNQPVDFNTTAIFPPPVPTTNGPEFSAYHRGRPRSLNWEQQAANIKTLYIDQDLSLDETMKRMKTDYGFEASEKMYKTQIGKWGWSKNLSSSTAIWILKKANKRKREEHKDTEFRTGHKVLSLGRVEQTVKRSKKSNEVAIPDDAPTPSGITYATPRNEMPSPSMAVSPRVSSAQFDRWTPRLTSHLPQPSAIRLVWNGKTKADVEALQEEAHILDDLGKFEDAERKFREALDGLQHLLSPTHEITNAWAYTFATFYAKHGHMHDAELVLNWMYEKHIERWGIRHDKTAMVLLQIVETYHSWSRTEDAILLMRQVMEKHQEVFGTEGLSLSSVHQHRHNPIVTLAQPSGSPRSPEASHSSDLSFMNRQLSLVNTQTKMKDETAEPLLQSMINQCKKNPDEFGTQWLKAQAALVRLYKSLAFEDKVTFALEQATAAFSTVIKLEHKKAFSILEAATEIAELYVGAGQWKIAETMFSEIQLIAVDWFGFDAEDTIRMLISIGMFYQAQQRWVDARPRFEQAYCASLTATGQASDQSKRLESALETERYEAYVPSYEDLMKSFRRRWTCLSH